MDVYNPKVIRSTMGSVLRVPFVYAPDLKEACGQMKKAGIRLYAAHLKGMHNYDQEDYTKATGFLIGNEAKGLTDDPHGRTGGVLKCSGGFLCFNV